AQEAFEAGTKVLAEGADAGKITSSAYSPVRGKVMAIAMMLVRNARPDMEFDVAGARARLRESR
ncbi:MAG: hypothetical protein JWO80_551, partial [Bryobacterales bacterium]|nr:hypothetical protein [Bryobacterales bacterium]